MRGEGAIWGIMGYSGICAMGYILCICDCVGIFRG